MSVANAYQGAFTAALLDPDLPCPEGLEAWNGSDPGRRFGVYRNNVVVSLIDALAENFPVTCELVGPPFFRAMARLFVSEAQPRSPLLAEYGQGFPAFIENFAPAESVPYLADVARLEALRVAAYHAPDASPSSPEVYRAALDRIEELPAARLRLHPSAALLRSSYAAFSLWAAHQGALDIAGVDPHVAEDVLVVRPHLEVLVLALHPGSAAFTERLLEGMPFGESATRASANSAGFDLAGALADLMAAGAIVDFDFERKVSP